MRSQSIGVFSYSGEQNSILKNWNYAIASRSEQVGAPNQLLQDAETIGIGFLAARTSSVLRQVLGGLPIGVDEEHVLADAARFLQDVSDGAQFTVSGNFREGASPSRSIAALDVAFGAIDVLKQTVKQDEGVASFFEDLADAVTKAREAGLTDDIATPLKTADKFFEALGTWLSTELRSRKPLIGTRRHF